MPRQKSYTDEDLADRAMRAFWQTGFSATSMDDLVKATGVSRHGLYQAASGKEGLFEQALDHYRNVVVTPAFQRVEAAGATLDTVRTYIEHQIALAQGEGLPGPGCLFGNTMTEDAAKTPRVRHRITGHLTRLENGIANALRNTAPHLSVIDSQLLARVAVTFLQGLWAISRTTDDAGELRLQAKLLMAMLEDHVAA